MTFKILIAILIGVLSIVIGYYYYYNYNNNKSRSYPLNFDGTGYTTIPAGINYTPGKSTLSFSFKTSETNGLLFIASASGIGLHATYIKAGKLVHDFNLGTEVVTIEPPDNVSTNKWVKVKIERNDSTTRVFINDGAVSTGTSAMSGGLSKPNLIYIGGTNIDTIDSPNYTGCMDHIVYNGRSSPDLEFDMSHGGFTIGGCSK